MGEDKAMTTQCGNSPVVEKNDCNKQSLQITAVHGEIFHLRSYQRSNQVPMEMDLKLGPADGEDLNKSR